MSQIYVMRKVLYVAETALVIADGASVYFKSIYISNSHNAAVKSTLAITRGQSFSAVGDYIIYEYSLAAGEYLKLEDIAIPVGHQLRAFCNHDATTSVVGTGIME